MSVDHSEIEMQLLAGAAANNPLHLDEMLRILAGKSQTLTAAGPISLDATHVALDSTGGAFAATLDAPTRAGIVKVIEMTVDGGDVTLALTNVAGGSAASTATFNAVGEVLTLISTSTEWIVLDEHEVTLA